MPYHLTTSSKKEESSLDNKQHKETVKKAIQAKFRGKEKVPANYIPLYPNTAEREMKRVINGYTKILNQEVKKRMPEIMAACKSQRLDETRYDDLLGLKNRLSSVFRKIAAGIEKATDAFRLRDKLASVASVVKNTALREWKRTIKRTFGLDLLADYYSDDFYRDTIERWVAQNVSEIQSIPARELGEMEQIIYDGFVNNRPISEIAESIQSVYNVTKSKAKFLARDQVGTLDAQITRRQQEDSGVEEYSWVTRHDNLVRDCHRALDGKTFRWDSPPEMWHMSKGVTVYSGRRCHPGEDYGCRCRASPVFNINSIDLPMQIAAENEPVDYFPDTDSHIAASSFGR